jgi:hypothetical protein
MKNKNNINGDEKLPGYPHYPVKEDLYNAEPENRLDGDVEDILNNPKNASVMEPASDNEPEGTVELVPGNDADVTGDDMYALGTVEGDLDGGEDERIIPAILEGPDLTGDDLDVPGPDEDHSGAEEAGSEDEENKLYSWGQGEW